jgi:hypothetical protein
MLKNINLTATIPGAMQFHAAEYKKVQTDFSLCGVHNRTLVAAMEEIFTNLGDERLPAFLKSVDTVGTNPIHGVQFEFHVDEVLIKKFKPRLRT